MKRQLAALAAGVAIVVTAACGGHAGVTPAPAGGSTPGNSSPAAFEWGQAQLRDAVYVGPATVQHLQVYALVRQQNAAGLIQYAQQVSDPSSPVYRHFLTPQEIGQRFGASHNDYQKAAAYFVSQGLSVAGWPQHLALSVSGTQAAMEHAFGTKFGLYQKNGLTFVAPIGTPRVSATVPLVAVTNLVALHQEHSYLVLPPRANVGSTLAYSPQQVRNAFDYSGAYSRGFNGTGITIGIIGTGPLNISRSSLCPASDKDLAAVRALYNNATAATVCEVDVTPSGVAAGLQISGIPSAAPASPNPSASPIPAPSQSPTSMFPFSGNFQSPPPVTNGDCTGTLPACNPEDGEAQLDVQQSALLAPGATVDFYLAYNSNDCYVFFPNSCATPPPGSKSGNYGAPQIGLVESDPEIEQAIADNKADVVSISYGLGEPQEVGGGFNSAGVGFEPEEFAALATEGIAVFVSSGDSGAAECLGANGYLAQPCVSWPSGDVNVTSVGGVNAPINEFGQLTGNITAWGVTNGGSGVGSGSWSGTGGGTSTIFAAPSWQHTAVNATMREQPDVALLADPYTGVTLTVNTGLTGSKTLPSGPTGIGGTSVAAPEMAAMWALVLQACKATPACQTGPSAHPYRLGNAAPYLYSIYHGSGLVPSASFSPHLPYADVFYDVLYGSNAMCPATAKPGVCGTPIPGQNAMTGYDQTTGVGVPYAGHLIQAVTGQVVP
ncbi:MAG TPA: protease pro-enzyme activation domain-containing protein [Candidatus Baltobacteraceae bacterium]|jgi:subtilase family serine protease|nr:protease pro-enzyme activation domain-containing protein [Candidatus Baltobacteraceae bacterium]